jgi:two-component system sensor histidine kinase ChiS
MLFTVSHSGPGLPDDELQRVWDLFERGPSSISGGADLELVMARGLVEVQGGRIWVETMPGEGTIFRFTLPLAGDASGADEAPPRQAGDAR